MKKFVLNLDLQNDKEQQRRALKTVSTLSGIDEISIDLKGKKLMMIGTVDPVSVVSKLRKKSWPAAHIISVGPAKEPEKKEEPKKEEPKKEEAKKEEEPKKEEPKKEEAKKEEAKEEPKKEEAKKEAEKKPELELVPAGMMPPMPGMMTPMPGMITAMPGMTPMPYRPIRQYYPPMPTYYPVHHSVEENPNACAIC